MIDLASLADLAERNRSALAHSVKPLTFAGRTFDTDAEPVLMGVVNLSRDSNYRESIAVSHASALRKAQVLTAQGAHLIDVGAESSRPDASRLAPEEQAASLRPVVAAMTEAGIAVSVEGYDITVARAGLESGAAVLNLTGSHQDDLMFAAAAEFNAAVVLCHVLGAHSRDLDGSDVEADPFPQMMELFAARIARAAELGVTEVSIDPGMGFGFRMDDPVSRAHHQATTLLNSFRLRELGAPICHALPHAFDVFEEEFRSAESFFAVLAHLGGTGVYRVHEVSTVRPALQAMHLFSPR